MNSQIPISVVALIISALSFLFSILSFAWQHLRKVDAAVCTLVASACDEKQGTFQFSFANLGTRPVLLREVSVYVFINPELQGSVVIGRTVVSGSLPQVVKAGEMCSISIQTKWQIDFLVKAVKESENRGGKDAELFFVSEAVCWNPKGEKLEGTKHIATFTYGGKSGQSKCYSPQTDASFCLTKQG